MFKRFMNIVKGSANKGMKKLETPELLAEEAEMELQKTVKELKEATIEAKTNEKLLQKKKAASEKKAAEWKNRATLAVQQKNDEVARQCLQKKKDLESEISSLDIQLEEQERASEALKNRLIQVEREFSEFKMKKQQLIARMNAGKAKEDQDEMDISSMTSGIDKFEKQIEEQELRNEVMREMSDEGLLEEEFKMLENKSESANPAIDDELAALKAQLNEDGEDKA